MVSYETFVFIHKRLTEIKGTDDTEIQFGGLNIIAVGGVHTVIIDEISMVSYETFVFIHKRLTEIKGTDDTEIQFGGLNIIAVGDFYQLPPVRDRFIFQNGKGYTQGSTHLWGELFTVIELTANMRQRNDTCYSEILNRIRTGNQTNEDIAKLRTRLTSGMPDPVQLNDPKFNSALYVLPRKEQVTPCGR